MPTNTCVCRNTLLPEAPGGARRRQEAPRGAKRRQEAPRGAKRRQEAPGAARRRQEAPGGARGRQGPPGGARRHGMPHTKVAFLNIPLSYLHISRGGMEIDFSLAYNSPADL